MTNLKKQRLKLNLTQEELAEKSGVSVRSIQRIEAGANLKGHTLRALAEALVVDEEFLSEEGAVNQVTPNYNVIRYINLSSLLFVVLPPLNIIIPILILFVKREFNHLTRQIVSIQILWTLLSVIFFLVGVMIKNWQLLGNKINLIILFLPVLLNLFIILRNAAEIDRKNRLYVKLNFSIV